MAKNRAGYKSSEDSEELLKKLREIANGNQKASTGNSQQEIMNSKEALAAPVVTPQLPSFQPAAPVQMQMPMNTVPAAQGLGVQQLIGKADIQQGIAMGKGTGGMVNAATSTMKDAMAPYIAPGDEAWKRNLALGGMNNLSQEELLRAREQANMDARAGKNPFDNLPQQPDTGKTVWWSYKNGQGSGTTTANYVIGRAEKAMEKGDYKGAMDAIEYGINSKMPQQDRQAVTDWLNRTDFGGNWAYGKTDAAAAKQLVTELEKTGRIDGSGDLIVSVDGVTVNLGNKLAVLNQLGNTFGYNTQGDATQLGKRLAQGYNANNAAFTDRNKWREMMKGRTEEYKTRNATTAFYQRGGDALDAAKRDTTYGRTAEEYQKNQIAKWVADWLADRLQVETGGTPMDLKGGQTAYAVQILRNLGFDVPELTEANYHQVVRQLQEQTGNRAAATRSQLQQGGFDVGTMEQYLTADTENNFFQGLQRVKTKEMSFLDKVAASIVSVPFAVYAQPVISMANVLKTMGPGRDTNNANTFMPVGQLIDNPSAAMRQEVSRDMGGAGRFVYNSVMSAVDSFVGSATLGNGHTVAMGLGAMGDEIQNAMDRGANPETAMVYGITMGLIEMLTEWASTEQIVKALRSDEVKTFVGRLIETGINGLTEGSEEIASDLLGAVTDAYLMRGSSEYNRKVEQLMLRGMSAEEAENEATADFVWQAMESGASGFLSGILSEGMAQGVSMARGKTKNRVDQLMALQDSEDEAGREFFRQVADWAGIEYNDSNETAREKLEAKVKESQENQAMSEEMRKKVEAAVKKAPAEVPGLAMNELTVDTVAEDTELILRAAEDAKTSQEAASAVKLAQAELNWIGNAVAMQKISEESGNTLANQLQRMIQSQQLMLGLGLHERLAEQEYGVDQAEMRQGAEADSNLIDNMEDESYGRTEGIEDGSERVAGVDPDQQAGRMGEDAGRTAEESGFGQRYRGAVQLGRETEAAGAEEQSAEEIGITGGSKNKTIRVVPDSVIEAHEELKAIRDEAKANGNNVVMVTGKLQVMQGGRAVLADGLYQPNDDGTATIYLQADNLNRSAAQIYNHETFHRLVANDRSLMEDILDSLLEQNDYDEEKVRRQAWRYAQAYGWIYGKPSADMSEAELDELAEQYLEEYFADAYGEIRRSGVDMEPAREAVAKNRESLDAARGERMQEQVTRMLETVEEPGDGGVVENEDGKGVVAYNGNGNAMLSISTYWSDGRSILKEWLDKNAGAEGYISRTEADEMLERMDEIVKFCEGMKGKSEEFDNWSYADVVVDEKGHPVFSVVKANGEYAMNLDFSLVCKKRRTLDMVLNELCENGTMNQISEMGEAALAYINDLIRQRGFEIACGLCFVDAKRYRQGIVADEFVTMYNKLVWSMIHGKQQSIGFFNYGKDKNATQLNEKLEGIGTIDQVPDDELNFEEIDRIIKEHDDADEAEGKNTAGSVEYRIAKALRNNPKMRKLAARSDFMATGGLDNTKIRNPELMKLFNSKKGTGGPKAAESDVQYLSDVIRSGKFEAAAAYAVGGVRIQSFSDYVPRLVVDYCQMIADLAAKKLPAHAYTKEALFALQFGMTGAMINMSLVPAYQEGGIAPGLDADGNYAWRDGQSFGSTDSGDKTYGLIRKILQKAGVKGMPSKLQREGSARWGFELAKVIQAESEYGKNCGTIAIGVSMWQILKMMDDPAIRMIIPYHKSGINHLVASFNWVDTFADFTGIQNTRYRSGKNLSKEDAGKFDFNAAVQKHDGDAKAATDEYLKWCKENDYIPKFAGEYREDSNVDWDAMPAEWKKYFEIVHDKKGTKVISHLDQHPEYYKLLIDFHSYDEAGNVTKQGAVQLKMPGEGSSFGSFAELVEAGLEADQELADRQKKEVPQIAEEIRSIAQAGVVDALGKTASTVLEEAQDMERKGYSTENILGRTGWSRDENGKWVLDENLKRAMELEQQGVAAKEIKKQTNWEPTKNGWKRGWKAGKRLSNEEMTERRLKGQKFSTAEDGDEMSPAEWYAQQQEDFRDVLFNSDIGERIDTVQREQAAVRTATEEKIRQAQKMNKQQLRAAMARTEADLRAIKAAQRAGIREDAGAVVDEMRGEESKILRNRMKSLQETLDITKQELARRQDVDRANRKEKARQRAMDNAVNLTQGQLQRKIAATEDKIKGMEAAIEELEGQSRAQETVREEKKKLQEELAAYREAKRINADENRKAEQEAKRQEKRKNQAERARSNFVTDVLNMFQIPIRYRTDVATGVAAVSEIMLREGKIDESNLNTLMSVLIESGEETVQAEQYLKQVRQDMRGQRIFVSPETRTEFGDEWAAFRKRAWANGIILTSDESDGGIDRTQMDIFGNERETSGKEALETLLEMVENGRNETITTRESMRRKQQEFGWKVEDQIAELRQKLLRQLDRFAAAAELEIEISEANEAEQLEQDRKLREKLSAKAERQARTDVFKAVKRLERLERTADPESKKAAQAVLKDIDTIARRVTPAGLEDLREMEMICREMMEGDNNFAPDQYMEARLARLQQYQIDDMPIEQVRQLAQDVLAVTYAIESRNKMLSKMKYDEREKMANAVATEISRTKGMKSGKLREWLRLEHIRPRTFFGMISGYREDGATMSVAQAIEDGQTKQMEYIRGAQRLFDEFTADKANQKWLKTASGKDAVWEDVLGVRMTPMMKVSLYMHSQNIQNRYHITEGAVVVPNETEYRKGNISNAYATGQKVQFTEMQLREIASSLSEQEIAFAKLLKKYYDEYSAARINETSMVLLGYERATTKNYFHIRVQNDSVANVDSYLATAQDGTLEGIGSVAKSRQQRSNKPILLEDANLATLDHIDKMAKYTGLAIPLRDLAAITTFIPNPKMDLDEKAPAKLWAAAYEARNNYVTVSEWIKRKWTAAAGEYLDRLKNDLQLPSTSNDLAGEKLGRLRGRLAGATLAFNPAVALSQVASYPGAVQTVGVAALLNGLKLWERVDNKLIEKYSPLLWYRTGGAEEELQNLSKAQGLEKKLPWLFGWIEFMDKSTVKRIWAACEWKVMHDTSFRPGNQADVDAGRDVFYMEVAKLFNRCVFDTQPNYSTFQRTQISRTPSDMVKFLTMYKTVPLQYYNMMFEAAGRLSTAKDRYKASQTSQTKRELKKARIFAARTFGGILTANVVYVAFKALVKGLLTGKVPEDEDGEMTFGAVAKQLGLDLADTYAGSIIGLSEIVGTIEEWTGLKDAAYSNGDSNVVIDTAGRVKDAGDMIFGAGSTKDLLKGIKELAIYGGKFLGIPTGNMEKYILGLVRRISPEAGLRYDNLWTEIDKKTVKKQKTGEEFRAALEILMENRTDGVADDTINEIQRLWEAGFDAMPSDITTGDDGEEMKLGWGEKSAYRQAWNETVTGTIDRLIEADMYQEADDETRAAMIRSLYKMAGYAAKMKVYPDYEPNDNEKWIAKAVAAAEAGIDVAEYIAYRGIEQNLDGKDENGKSVDGLKDERIRELLDRTGWNGEQKAVVYGYAVSEEKNEKLDELYGIGLEYQQANDVANAGGGTKSVMAALSLQGMSDKHRYQAAMVYAGKLESKKLEAGQEFGVKPSQYAEVLRNADADGNGKVSQQEAEDYISGMNIGIQQKAYLWQMVTDGKDGINNQFGQTFGAEFYKWMHRNDE